MNKGHNQSHETKSKCAPNYVNLPPGDFPSGEFPSGDFPSGEISPGTLSSNKEPPFQLHSSHSFNPEITNKHRSSPDHDLHEHPLRFEGDYDLGKDHHLAFKTFPTSPALPTIPAIESNPEDGDVNLLYDYKQVPIPHDPHKLSPGTLNEVFENLSSQTSKDVFSSQPRHEPLPPDKADPCTKSTGTLQLELVHDEILEVPLSGPQAVSLFTVPTENITKPAELSVADNTNGASPLEDYDELELSNFVDSMSQEARDSFVKLCPLFETVNVRNFCNILVKCLKQYHTHTTHEDIYILLYDFNKPEDQPEDQPSHSSTSSELEAYSVEKKLNALKFYHLVLKTFRTPLLVAPSFPDNALRNPLISCVSLHELSRCFLAIKIILSSVKRTSDCLVNRLSVCRMSFYKVYCILCHKLFERYPSISSNADFNQSIIIGNSQFGKLVKLAIPNMSVKRIGRRGDSKFHYIDLTWDDTVVDEDILRLSELSIKKLTEHFNDRRKRRKPNGPGLASVEQNEVGNTPLIGNSMPICYRPLHSFVDISCRYSDVDCSPRLWNITPKQVPRRSDWANVNIQKSLGVLKTYKVDLDPVMKQFNNDLFSANTNDVLSKTVIKAMTVLSDASAEKEAYMHIYLVIFLLLLPSIIAADTEVAYSSKMQLRTSIKSFIEKLESETASLPHFDLACFRTFTKVLNQMVALNEMTSCKVKHPHAETVLNEIIGDIEQAVYGKSRRLQGVSNLEEMYIQSITMVINAYNLSFLDESTSDEAETDVIAAISELAKIFNDLMIIAKDKFRMLTSSASSQCLGAFPEDLPHQLFRLAIQSTHENALKIPLVLKCPMVMMIDVMRHMSISLQNASFNGFRKRDTEVSKETFKCLWVTCSMIQEYVSIMSEVVSLSQILSSSDTPSPQSQS